MPSRRTVQLQAAIDLPEQQPLEDRTVSLALQGGASFGAYTWGVLDALLADGRLELDGVTGCSAGAINAAALGVGWAIAGREGARDRLRAFWEGLGRAADRRRRGRFDLLKALMKALPRIGSSDAFYALSTRLVADFSLDPDTTEPLRSTLRDTLDFDALARLPAGGLKVFVNATDVETAQPVVFASPDLTVDAVCASCAVPFLFKPIEIDGRWYWDGGLLGNPAIYPVIYGCESRDIVLVETQSIRSPVPKTAAELMSRTMDLASTAGLVRELRTIRFVTQLLHDMPRPGMREIRLHHIPSHPALATVDGGRRFRADVPYFRRLADLGREAGREWLRAALPLAADPVAAGGSP